MKNLIPLIFLLILFGCNTDPNKKSGTEGDSRNQYANIPFVDTLFRADDPYEFRPWQIKSFVDKSGNPTNEKYIKYYTTTFIINNDTSFIYVYVEIIVTRNAAGIFIHDYGSRHPSKKPMDTVTMEIQASKDDRSVIIIDSPWDSSGGFRIEDKEASQKSYFTTFLNYLKNRPEGFRVIFEDEILSEYSFYVSTDGFSEELALL